MGFALWIGGQKKGGLCETALRFLPMDQAYDDSTR